MSYIWSIFSNIKRVVYYLRISPKTTKHLAKCIDKIKVMVCVKAGLKMVRVVAGAAEYR